MKKFLIAFGLGAVLALPVFAATPSAQNARMTQCNADATAQHLKGAARKDFMKSCLAGAKASAPEAAKAAVPAKAVDKNGKALTAQQQKMVTCNADAKAKGLKGEARKAFMKDCLSNKK